MAHPVLDEILRARLPIQPHVLKRWQQVVRDELIPALDRAEDAPAKPAKGKAA